MRVIINSDDYFELNNIIDEKWLPVKDFENVYCVSNYGRVKNILTNHILKCSLDSHGYYALNLYDKNNNKRNFITLHRLLAETFIPNPENKPQVNHKDGNKSNSYLDNLEWSTASENTQHAYDNNLIHLKKGANSPNAIPIIQYSLNGEFIKYWGGATCVMNELGINKSNIIQCCKGNVRQAGGYKWKYANVKEGGK